MNFINNVEMAALVDAGMAETEVTKTTDKDQNTVTTIYAGAPFREARQVGEQFSTVVVWKIRRTIIFESQDGNTTTVQNQWASGNWADRANLTYQYL